jgi:protein-S-isoprenylcysteine O-methyltransferase Ste14
MLGTGSVAVFGLLVFGTITGAMMIRMEDKELETRFGEAYRRYRQAVSAFLPKTNW